MTEGGSGRPTPAEPLVEAPRANNGVPYGALRAYPYWLLREAQAGRVSGDALILFAEISSLVRHGSRSRCCASLAFLAAQLPSTNGKPKSVSTAQRLVRQLVDVGALTVVENRGDTNELVPHYEPRTDSLPLFSGVAPSGSRRRGSGGRFASQEEEPRSDLTGGSGQPPRSDLTGGPVKTPVRFDRRNSRNSSLKQGVLPPGQTGDDHPGIDAGLAATFAELMGRRPDDYDVQVLAHLTAKLPRGRDALHDILARKDMRPGCEKANRAYLTAALERRNFELIDRSLDDGNRTKEAGLPGPADPYPNLNGIGTRAAEGAAGAIDVLESIAQRAVGRG